MLCAKCGKDNSNDSGSCIFCGQKLDATNIENSPINNVDSTAEQKLLNKKDKLNKILIILFSVFLGLASVFDIISLYVEAVALPFVISSFICLLLFFITAITGKILKKKIIHKIMQI